MGIIVPVVANAYSLIEKSARRFPIPISILAKILELQKSLNYEIGKKCTCVEWVGGMFMFFPAAAYKNTRSFDEKYYLYYKDVDICARLWLTGYKVIRCPLVS